LGSVVYIFSFSHIVDRMILVTLINIGMYVEGQCQRLAILLPQTVLTAIDSGY